MNRPNNEETLALIESHLEAIERALAASRDPSVFTAQLVRFTTRGQTCERFIHHPHPDTSKYLRTVEPKSLRDEIASFIKLRAPYGTVKILVLVDDPDEVEGESYRVRYVFYPLTIVDMSKAASA